MTRLLILLVRLYQLTFAAYLGGRCRYWPSCSAYAIEALTRHGAMRGGALAVGRVLRCSPLCRGGHDPVPTHAFRRACDAPASFPTALFGVNRTPLDGP